MCCSCNHVLNVNLLTILSHLRLIDWWVLLLLASAAMQFLRGKEFSWLLMELLRFIWLWEFYCMFHQTDCLVKFLFIFLLTVSPSFFYTMLLLGGDNHQISLLFSCDSSVSFCSMSFVIKVDVILCQDLMMFSHMNIWCQQGANFGCFIHTRCCKSKCILAFTIPWSFEHCMSGPPSSSFLHLPQRGLFAMTSYDVVWS